MLKKKYYDGFEVYNILNKHLEPKKKMEVLTDFAEAKGVDAVEVIRCKDCKHWLPHSQFGFDEDNDEYYDYCELLVPDDDYYAITRQAEDYCSRAEKK